MLVERLQQRACNECSIRCTVASYASRATHHLGRSVVRSTSCLLLHKLQQCLHLLCTTWHQLGQQVSHLRFIQQLHQLLGWRRCVNRKLKLLIRQDYFIQCVKTISQKVVNLYIKVTWTNGNESHLPTSTTPTTCLPQKPTTNVHHHLSTTYSPLPPPPLVYHKNTPPTSTTTSTHLHHIRHLSAKEHLVHHTIQQ